MVAATIVHGGDLARTGVCRDCVGVDPRNEAEREDPEREEDRPEVEPPGTHPRMIQRLEQALLHPGARDHAESDAGEQHEQLRAAEGLAPLEEREEAKVTEHEEGDGNAAEEIEAPVSFALLEVGELRPGAGPNEQQHT